MEYDPNSRIFNPDLAGGALLDVGVYPIVTANTGNDAVIIGEKGRNSS
jgi:hypothetical protein